MNIILHGYGSMGKAVHSLAESRGHTVTHIATNEHPLTDVLSGVSGVIIDFSASSAVKDMLLYAGEHSLPVVIGTTGWSDSKDALYDIAREYNIGVVEGSNFSLGVNIMMRTLRSLAAFTAKTGGFDCGIVELHHHRKADSPSGTALSLANILLQETSKSEIVQQTNGAPLAHQLHVASLRVGEIYGTHTVYFDGQHDTIELTHRAKSRIGFAEGALLAAEWIEQKTGWFSFQDCLDDILSTK